MPLFKIPSPEDGFVNFAEYYALEFKKAFNELGFHPEIIWTKDLYTSGKMNEGIRIALDNAAEIRKIYEEMYKKPMASDWYPFQVYCESCGKVSTTRVYDWDGENVSYRCLVDATEWTKGCGYEGKVSPFSTESGMTGKLTWKVDWPAKWQAIGVTVEGAGKDHMSKGGSHDVATQVCERVLNYAVPFPVGYEFMLIGGKKMSSSKGRGFAASDMTTILPPELVRFLIVKMDPRSQTNFDPGDGDTIPKLFDEYQEYARHFIEKKEDDEARIFELSQIDGVSIPPLDIRFSTLAQWVQMPNMQQKISDLGLEEWAKYARIWIERFAPENEKFLIQKDLPSTVATLSEQQKTFIKAVADMLEDELDAETFQKAIYEKSKELGISSKDAFGAIYTALLGKANGPKAGWLILSLDKDFVKNRFIETSESKLIEQVGEDISYGKFNNPEIFSIVSDVKEKYPSLSVGVAIIRGVNINEKNNELEKEKMELFARLSGLTTEVINEYPEVKAYRTLYKEMGVDWHSRRPSPEALLRRISQGKDLYTINTCVDAYNLVVMDKRISIGAFDLDTLSLPTSLRLAREGEEILLLGDSEATIYKSSELAYFDQIGGYNIDFNYRDAIRTAVTGETKNIMLNVDGVYGITPQQVNESLHLAAKKIIHYCGGEIESIGVVTATD